MKTHTRATLLCGLVALAVCGKPAAVTLVDELRDHRLPRAITPRLSVPVGYRAPGQAQPDERVLALSARAAQSMAADRNQADGLHASALVQLVFGAHRGNAIDTSISYLRSVVQLTDDPVAPLIDLSAAQLVRWERHDDPYALFAAVEAADSALVMQPEHPAALFNLGLALQALGLTAEARHAWERYLSVDSSSEWASEVRQRASRTPPPTSQPPEWSWPAERLREAARSDPQLARTLALERWFPAWGRAVASHDDSTAHLILRGIGTLGEILVDRVVLDAVVAAGAPVEDARVMLGRRWVAYGDAQAAAAATRHSDAARAFRAALGGRRRDPLTAAATMGLAVALVYGGDAAERERLLTGLRTDTVMERYPALRGRAHWAQGTLYLRSGHYERATASYDSARAFYDKAGERQNAGALRALDAEARLNIGDRRTGYSMLVDAIRNLGAGPPTVWLHNALIIGSRNLEGEGFTRTALRMSNEDVGVAEGLGKSIGLAQAPEIYRAESVVARARLLQRSKRDAVPGDLHRADSLLRRVPPGFAREWVGAQLQHQRAAMLIDSAPAAAIPLLAHVIDAFDGGNALQARNAARHVAALSARARAWMRIGDSARAMADAGTALREVRGSYAAISREGNRATLLGSVREVTDTLASLRLASGDPLGALQAITLEGTWRRPATEPPAGSITIVLRRIGERIIAWNVTPESVSVRETPIDGVTLERRIRRLRALLERRASTASVISDLTVLYDLVLRPALRDVPPGPITILPDGILAGIPFAALRDSSTGRYLVEMREVRVASRLDAERRRHAGRVRDRRVLLVADPSFSRARHPELRSLDAATSEVAEIAALYPGARTIRGDAANRREIESALQRSSVVHYAGHAIFQPAAPEQSFLVLAFDEGAQAGDRLTAEQIGRLDLRGVELLVLAACETLGGGFEPDVPFRGFASAALSAGARGVVGSLWRVDDAATKALMVEMHRDFVTSRNGAGALRHAQMRMISSESIELSSPSAWAAFLYFGN